MPPARDRKAIRALLLALVGDDLQVDAGLVGRRGHALTELAWQQVPAACDSHGITLQARASTSILQDVAPAAVMADLRTRGLAHAAAGLKARAALEQISSLFAGAGVRWALLKGPVLAAHVYRVAGRRSFSDLDVLVEPREVRPALEALEAMGAVLITRNWTWLGGEGRHEMVLRLPNGVDLDLHWRLLKHSRRERRATFDAGQLLDRSRRVGLAGEPAIVVPALSAADQLIHVVTHAVQSGFGPLRYCLDVDQLVRHDLPSADDLGPRLIETGCALPVAVGIARAASTLSGASSVPALPEVHAASRTAWARAMHVVDRLNPPPRSHEAWPLQFFTGSTRASTGSSVATLIDFGATRLGALRHPGEFRRRLRQGIQHVHMPDEETRDVDGGQREVVLRQLDAS